MKKTIEIHGMSCGHCEGRVEEELKKLPEIESVEASAENKNAVINLTKDIDDKKLNTAVEKAGYEFVKVIK